MLHIVKQIKGVFMGMLISEFSSGDAVNSNEKDISVMTPIELAAKLSDKNTKLTAELKKQMKDFVNSIDGNDNTLDASDQVNSTDQEKLESIVQYLQERQLIDKTREDIQKAISGHTTLNLQNEIEKINISNGVKKEVNKVKSDVEKLVLNGDNNDQVKTDVNLLESFEIQRDKKNIEKVKELQQVLNTLGFKGANGKELVVDGLWGNNTARSLDLYKVSQMHQRKSAISIENNISEQDNKIQPQTTIEKEILTSDEKIIMNFKRGTKEEIIALQKILKARGAELGTFGTNKDGIDGDFGPTTRKALRAEKLKINKKVNGEEIIFERTDTIDPVIRQVEKAQNSVADLKTKLELTSLLNTQLSDYDFADSRGFSLERGLRKLFGENENTKVANLMVANVDAVKEKFAKNEDKIAAAIASMRPLVPANEAGSTFLQELSNNNIVENIFKVAPWLFGIYLGDIPLPFIQKMAPGVDLNKSIQFKNWLASDMKTDFTDYVAKNPSEITVLKEQYTLRGMLSKLTVSDKGLTDELGNLTKETKELITLYIKERLIPDLKVLDSESFSWYEFFDKKANTSGEALRKLQEMTTKDKISMSDIEKLTQAIMQAVVEEADIHEGHINVVDRRQNYMKEVSNQNLSIEHITWLHSNELPEVAILFHTETVTQLAQMGATKPDAKLLGDLETAILEKNVHSLRQILNEGSVKKFLDSIGDPKMMQEYQLSQLKSYKIEKLEYTNVGNAKHGISIEEAIKRNPNMPVGEALHKELFLTTTELGGKMPAMTNVMRSFIEKGGMSGITGEEIADAIKSPKSKLIDYDQFTLDLNTSITNTGRQPNQEILSSFQELIDGRNDKNIFKLSPIEKSYTYYKDGQTFEAIITYDLYMRPDCSNPLIVPNSIEIKSVPNSTLEFPTETMILVDGKLPLVIPYTWINGGGKTTGSEPHVSTTPGVTDTGNVVPGNGVSDAVSSILDSISLGGPF